MKLRAMTYARHHLVTPGVAGTYHCVSRCVRRAYLCGFDALSGRSFEHRKAWLEHRLLALSDSFAVSILAYAVMSNHVHLVVHVDPLAPRRWTDEQVARRWVQVYAGGAREADAKAARIRTLMADGERLDTLRERLGSLSEFMSALIQPIARRANREDGVTGRFWEGRFRSQALLDERAVLACMAYVDLNPLRAGRATSLERSEHTSVRRRIAHGVGDVALRPLAGLTHAPIPQLSQRAYVDLVRWSWTASAEGAADRSGAPPALRQWVGEPHGWVRQLQATETAYAHAIGSLQSLLARARALHQRWLRGVGFARSLNRPRPSPT